MGLRHQVRRSSLGVLREENSKVNTRRLFNQQGMLVLAQARAPRYLKTNEEPRIVMCEEGESWLTT
jgi:hypothetical protein